jgi:hypothetical protein
MKSSYQKRRGLVLPEKFKRPNKIQLHNSTYEMFNFRKSRQVKSLNLWNSNVRYNRYRRHPTDPYKPYFFLMINEIYNAKYTNFHEAEEANPLDTRKARQQRMEDMIGYEAAAQYRRSLYRRAEDDIRVTPQAHMIVKKPTMDTNRMETVHEFLLRQTYSEMIHSQNITKLINTFITPLN